jgi:hypothetical protein
MVFESDCRTGVAVRGFVKYSILEDDRLTCKNRLNYKLTLRLRVILLVIAPS